MEHETQTPEYIVTHKELMNAEPAHHQGLQVMFMPYKDAMIAGWWILFFLTSAILISIFLKRIYQVNFKK